MSVRTFVWKAGRKPAPARRLALGLAALLGTMAIIFALSVGASRLVATRVVARIEEHRPILGIDGLEFSYLRDMHFHRGWAPDWLPSAFSQAPPHALVHVYESPFSLRLPFLAVVEAPNGLPDGPTSFFQLLGLWLSGVLLVVPAWLAVWNYRHEVTLVEYGRVTEGRVIRHKLLDRAQRGRPVHVHYHYRPAGVDQPLEGRMRVPREVYLTVQNTQRIKVLYGRSPADSLIYDFCDFEVDAPYRQEFGYLTEASPDSTQDPLPLDIQVRHGFGPMLILWWGYLRTGLMAAVLTAPLWGWNSWGLHRTAEHAVGYPGIMCAAPWLLWLLGGLLLLYGTNLTLLFWFVKAHEAARVKPSRQPGQPGVS